LPYPEKVILNIYNTSGILIKNLVNEKKAVGVHRVIWDGKNQKGYQVSSGIYFYKLETSPGLQQIKKATLIR
jgi:flagellar hook assembly protein FlgD